MNLQAVSDASLPIKIHLATVIPAFFIGGWLIFFSTKGARLHRAFGVIYLVLMTLTAIDAFFVRVLDLGHLSWIHLFIPLTLYGVIGSILALRRHDIAAHKRAMVGTYVGALLIAGAFTFMPGRLMHAIFFG